MVMDGMMSFCAGYRIIQEAGVNSLHKSRVPRVGVCAADEQAAPDRRIPPVRTLSRDVGRGSVRTPACAMETTFPHRRFVPAPFPQI
jgi:hypothetical protein